MKLIQIFFSPIGFAVGFLTPLLGQGLTHFNVIERCELAYAIGFVIALSDLPSCLCYVMYAIVSGIIFACIWSNPYTG